ncbi:MAG: putative cytosol aminopeptidase [Acidobacteriota bacterium]
MGQLFEVVIAGRRPPAGRFVVGAFRGARTARAGLPAAVAAAVGTLLRRRGWKGSPGQVATTSTADGRLIEVRGLGETASFDAPALRGFLEAAIDSARAAVEPRITVALPDHDVARGESAAVRSVRDAALCGYRFDRFRGDHGPAAAISIALLPAAGEERSWRAALPVGVAVAAGVELARDLANTPPNVATPAWMAAQATALARRHRGRVTVLSPAELKRRGMGGLLAVGGGSANPPRLVRVELGRGRRTVALVGKGVTFDTGGISIKPAAQMDEMKWDKSGACAVLGSLEAMARLRLPIRVRAYLPLAENMPDGEAYRPGDIVRCANGKTVEITNTDAEGRMILADALSWAVAEKPEALVEMSTLTGACVVALGPTGAGLFTPDDELAAALLAAAEASGDRLWRLPLWPEFLEEMRGSHADLRNSGGRWGGASTAAAFLSQFATPLESWAHLDIAGPAYVGEGKGKRGATGYGVALTIHWLRRLATRTRRAG